MKFLVKCSIFFFYSVCIVWTNSQSGIPYRTNQSASIDDGLNRLSTNSSVSFFTSNQYSGASVSYQTSYEINSKSMLNSKINLKNYNYNGLYSSNLVDYNFNYVYNLSNNLHLSIGVSGLVGDPTNKKVKAN